MKKIVSLLLIILLSTTSLPKGFSQTQGAAIGFQDALRITQRDNSSLLASRERLEQALQRIMQARSYFLPEISAAASENRKTINLDTFGVPVPAHGSSLVGPFNVFDARVRVTQTLFDWPMVKRFQAALAGEDLSKAELRKIQEDVLALTGTLFVRALRAESRVEFAKENLRLAASRHKILKQRLELGTASVTEVQSAKAYLSEARYAWRLSVSAVSAALLDLKEALGFSVSEPLVLCQETAAKTILPRTSEITKNISAHPDVKALAASQKFEETLEKAEQASYLPVLQGSADYGVNGRTIDGTEDTYFFGAEARWNFFDFGRRAARAAEAHSRVNETKINLDQALREKESKIYEARDQIKSAEKYLEAKKDGLVYRKSFYESAKNKFQNGSASRLELIEASALLAGARDEWEDAQSLLWTARINLFHAEGKMNSFLEEKS